MIRIASTVLSLTLFAVAPAAAAAPKAVVSEPRFEFGTVGRGEDVRHSFVVRNEGDAPLELARDDNQGAGQKNVRLAADAQPIAPGGSAKLEVIFENTGVPAGPVEMSLPLTSNDPALPKLALVLAGTVQDLLGAKPGYARWNTVQGENEATIAQTIWTADGSPFRVLSVDAPPYVRTKMREALPAERDPKSSGPQWRVELTLDSWAPVGAITGPAVVHTDYAKQRRAVLPLSGFVRPLMHVEPITGELGTLNVAGTAKVDFKVRFFGTAKIQLTAAEVTVPGANTTITPLQEGRLYQVTLQLTPAVAAGPLDGKLILRTDSTKVPVREIALSGKIEGGKIEGGAAASSGASTDGGSATAGTGER